MNRRLYSFLHALTSEQQQLFAKLAKTTVGTMRHYVTGRRSPRSGAAIAMEHAAVKLREQIDGLPPLGRRDLSPECRRCEYAKRCIAEDTEPLA